jgi:hypothetical protein
MTTVNATGLREIAAFLAEHHRLGGDFTPAMLAAWARDAEFQMGEGNPPCIEIPARDAVGGAAIELRISPAGIDK